MFLKTFEAEIGNAVTELQTDSQSEQRNVSGTVTLFSAWLASIGAAGNRFEWETGQTQFSGQMKHKVKEIWSGLQADISYHVQ